MFNELVEVNHIPLPDGGKRWILCDQNNKTVISIIGGNLLHGVKNGREAFHLVDFRDEKAIPKILNASEIRQYIDTNPVV